MKPYLIAAVVVVVVAGLAYFIVTQIRAVTARASAISDDVITRYVDLLKQERFGEAWEGCLAKDVQARTPRDAFVAAQAAHWQEYGPLQGWDQTDYQHEANLFTSESLIGINAILHYKNRDVFVLYKVDSAVEPFRILEIFGSPGTSTTLSSGIW